MATKKVVYFTAGINATSGELADIAKLNAAAEARYEVLVVNGAANAEYGETDRIIPSDYVAGTVPSAYSEVDVIDPDSIPNQALTPTEAIVQAGTPIDITGGTVTFTVEDNVITGGVFTPA